MRKIFLLLFLILFQQLSFAQKSQLDSLKTELLKAKQDTTKLNIYDAILKVCDSKDYPKYVDHLLKLADKLLSHIKSEKEREKVLEQKLNALESQIEFFFESGTHNAEKNVKKIFESYVKILIDMKDTLYTIKAYTSMAATYFEKGNYSLALEYVQEGLSLSEEMNYKNGTVSCLTELARMYREQGENKQALANYQNAFSIASEIKDTSKMIDVLGSFGWYYAKLNNSKKALECYQNIILLANVKKDSEGAQNAYTLIAEVYRDNKNYENALLNFQKALSISEQKNDKYWSCGLLSQIGETYQRQGNFSLAIDYYSKSLKLGEKLVGHHLEFPCKKLATVYFIQKNYRLAKMYCTRALDIEKGMFFLKENSELELLASQIDSALGNGNGAYEHYKQYVILGNKLKGDEIHKAAEKEKFQKEYDKQKAEQNKKDSLAKAQLKQQTFQRNAFIGGFALMLLLAGVSYRNFIRKKKDNLIITEQKNVVEIQNKEIKDSIQYALRIQTAILPPQKIVKQYLENSFILYKPKDIVAGDFYWMEAPQPPEGGLSQPENGNYETTQSEILNPKSEIILFAACDCTGHGVPGAMVSVVCHNALNRAVREFGLKQPAAILDKTAELVIENFSKSEEDIKDGMDISLCSLNFNKVQNFVKGEEVIKAELQWSGANNPLWIVRSLQDTKPSNDLGEIAGQARNDAQGWELIETKADKQPIGMNEDSKPFTNHTFTLNSGDTIYLFTDGFADQFGGETGQKKLTKKRFKDLILSIQNLSMQEQGIALDKFITEYRKEVEQIDDILVMGVKV